MNAQQHAERATRVLAALDADLLEADRNRTELPAAEIQAALTIATAHAQTALALKAVCTRD